MTVSGPNEFELNTGTPLTMGVNTPFQVVRFTGPRRTFNSNDLAFTQSDGVYRARDTRGGMTFSVDLEVEADEASIADNVALLLAAWVPVAEGSDLRFTWQLQGQTGSRYVLGTPRAVNDVIWDQKTDVGDCAVVHIDFFASIPVIRLTSGDTVVAY